MNVSPFGLRFAGPLHAEARERFRSEIESSLRQQLMAEGAAADGNPHNILDDPDKMRELADEMLDRMTATPDEGIEDRSSA